ncbi:MAG: hypothetical protein A3D13_01415 [Planctomycetes bacterium RIFCSPHIGHO2_02_FULL_40_12]|nr:MAG: hypothetical protein A3D13_01415 [Planctomycetes bacterium RIFCSPHIGHO2_02_FULL_40_12]OHC02989.1 MAG: hypothetical protein A3H23_06585 [Planctomycetes bacterium RIFCSPLOWO2_12_FULL_40_19]
MKIFILIFIIFVVSIIVTLKLITSQEHVMSPDIPKLDSKEYDAGKQMYQDNKETLYRQSTETEINNQKLRAFAKAFVNVQSYMNKAGSKAIYKETMKIVHNQGLSVNDYTRIATMMNENPDFRNNVEKMINEAK